MDLETVKHEARNVVTYVTAALSGETRVPVPGVLESASVAVAAGLSSPRFPLHIPHVDLSDVALSRALLAVLLAPLMWNFIARFEYYTRILSKLFFRPIIATYALAAWIFFFSLYRDALFAAAMETQERLDELDTPVFHAFAGALAVVGGVLVLTSFVRLGVTGTYLGDYFGILMNEQVTGFPFTILEHPMYDGTTMIFLALAILERSPAGILLCAWIYIVYRLACLFEGFVQMSSHVSYVNMGGVRHMSHHLLTIRTYCFFLCVAAVASTSRPFTAKIYGERDLARTLADKKKSK